MRRPPACCAIIRAQMPPYEKSQPPLLYPPYQSTRRRAPSQPLIQLPARLLGPRRSRCTATCPIGETDNDLTRQHRRREPQGERIIVAGRVVDEDGRPVPHALVEIWQANAAGRYRHVKDNHPAPLDPQLHRRGPDETDAEGRYRFTTIKPGAYPWRNHHNAWRPAHIHFSLFGPSFLSRLVTQMYFPDDPLFPHDPMFQSIPDERARAAAGLDVRPGPDRAGVGARLPVRHRPARRRLDAVRGAHMSDDATAGRHARRRPSGRSSTSVPTTNPQLGRWPGRTRAGERIHLRVRVIDGDGAPVPDALVEMWQADAGGAFTASRSGPAAGAAFAASAGCRPTPTAVRVPRPSGPARRAAKRRTSTCAFSCAGCCATSTRASTLPAIRRWTRPRAGAGAGGPPRHAARARPERRRRWVFDLRLQGDQETVFFDL